MLKLLALALLVVVTAAATDYPNIENLLQIDATLNSVTLSWTLDISDYIPFIYTLVVNGVLTRQFFHDGTFTYIATDLSSCSQYSFDLKADYNPGVGNSTMANGSTLNEIPGSITDLTVVGNTLSWTPPSNSRCVQFYNVCYVSVVTDNSQCEQWTTSPYDLSHVSGCDDVTVKVSAVIGDLEGPASEVRMVTEYATPGIARNFEVTLLSETSVELAWDDPLENEACVKDYAIKYGCGDTLSDSILEVEDNKAEQESDDNEEEDLDDEMRLGPSGQEHTAILSNLLPCTECSFGVSTVSNTDEHGPEVIEILSTNGTAPGEVPDITYVNDDDSITINWGDVSAETCMKFIQICYSDPFELHTECFEVPKSPNTWTLGGLKPCREYDFMIRGMTSDGQSGPPRYISVSIQDVAPGPVREMHLGSIGVTSITVTYMDPLLQPECADRFVITYSNVEEKINTTKKISSRGSDYIDQINGLDACSLYEVGVYAVSASGLEGNITIQTTDLKDTIPEPPITGTMLSATRNSATLLWYAPRATRFCVDSYTVKISQPGGSPVVTETVNVTSTNEEVLYTFAGLAPCTGYVAEMSATNDKMGSSVYYQVVSDIMTKC